MKILQKKSVAILLTVVMVLAGVGIGQVRANQAPPVPTAGETALDTTLSTAAYENWLWDEADVFSKSEEKQICIYNANWDKRYTSLVAVAAVKSVTGDLADYAYELGNDIGLGQGMPCWFWISAVRMPIWPQEMILPTACSATPRQVSIWTCISTRIS